MILLNEYIERVIATVEKRDSEKPEFIQTVKEVLGSLDKVVAEHPEYDGLIIFTDGYAPKPEVPAKLKGRLLWILRSEKEYNDHRIWMKESGRACFIENR